MTGAEVDAVVVGTEAGTNFSSMICHAFHTGERAAPCGGPSIPSDCATAAGSMLRREPELPSMSPPAKPTAKRRIAPIARADRPYFSSCMPPLLHIPLFFTIYFIAAADRI